MRVDLIQQVRSELQIRTVVRHPSGQLVSQSAKDLVGEDAGGEGESTLLKIHHAPLPLITSGSSLNTAALMAPCGWIYLFVRDERPRPTLPMLLDPLQAQRPNQGRLQAI